MIKPPKWIIAVSAIIVIIALVPTAIGAIALIIIHEVFGWGNVTIFNSFLLGASMIAIFTIRAGFK